MNHPVPMGLNDSALTDSVSISLAATDVWSTPPLVRAVTDIELFLFVKGRLKLCQIFPQAN